MRYAFISDLHANLQAWRAVHLDIRSNTVDYTICLGDIVGYGPSPAELLNEAHAHIDAFVLGNHDAVVSGKMADSSFNPEARDLIRWTATRLNRKAAAFLRSLPLTLVGNGFRCAHGEFARPANFDYVLNPDDALPSWQAVDSPLLLAGHTHAPAFFLMGPSGIPRETHPQDFEMEPGKRYFVNVGSVGYSRDGDPRASYCIYDTQNGAVFWRRVPFDLDSYRTTLIHCGLDPSRSHLLKSDPRALTIPVRELLDFTPPAVPEKAVRNAVEARDITTLKRSIKLWKRLFLATIIMLIAVGIVAWLSRDQHQHRSAAKTRSKTTKRVASVTETNAPDLKELPEGKKKKGKAKSSKAGSRRKKTLHYPRLRQNSINLGRYRPQTEPVKVANRTPPAPNGHRDSPAGSPGPPVYP